MEELDDEKMLASAVAFLAVGQEHEQEASATLLAHTVKVYDSGSTWWVGNELQQGINIHLSGPRTAYEIICDAILPEGTYLDTMTASAEIVNIDPDWQANYLEFLMDEQLFSRRMFMVVPGIYIAV